MASGKRASMREGPLSDLFRRTDEEPRDGRPGPGTPPQPEHEEAPPVARTEPVPEPPVVEPEVTEPDGPHIPTPQERLRHAFSADIPENIMAPVTPAAEAEAAAPKVYTPAAEPEVPRGRSGTPVLRVVGVGGAGVNAVNRMVETEIEGVEFLAVNTDVQSLQGSAADITLHIGSSATRGLGSGSDPDLGRQSAMEEYDKIKALLKGSDMVFVTAGAGGGTGTGAAPLVARIAREVGAIAVGIVTKPFGFEGSRRREQAEDGIQALADEVDTLIVVPNNRLLSVLDKQTSMVEAFRVADDVLRQGVQGISDLVTLPGLINLDFADVRTVMSEAGNALLGIGMASGDRRAMDAAEKAVASPLLETSMDGARSILLSITGGRDLSLWEVNEAAKAVAEAAHPDANIIFGAMIDERLEDQVWVTVVATGYGEGDGRRPEAERDRDAAGAGAREKAKLTEPRGEPRVARTENGKSAGPRVNTRGRKEGARRMDIWELDVPEFIPRG